MGNTPTKSRRQPRPSDAEIRRLYVEEQLSQAAIGARLGVSSVTARKWLLAAGVEQRPVGGATQRSTAPDAETLRRLYVDQGLTQVEIAAELGVAPQSVSRWLSAAEITPADKPDRRRRPVRAPKPRMIKFADLDPVAQKRVRANVERFAAYAAKVREFDEHEERELLQWPSAQP